MRWVSLQANLDWQLSGLAAVAGTMLAGNLLHWLGAYRVEALRQAATALRPTLIGWMMTMGVLAAVLILTGSSAESMRAWMLLWAAGGPLLLIATRLGIQYLFGSWGRAGRLCRTVAVVGAGPIGQGLLRQLNASGESRVRVVGVYDDRRRGLPKRCMGRPILGDVDDLVRDVRHRHIDSVIVALPLSADWRLAEIMNKLLTVPVDVRVCLDQFGFQLGICQTTHFGGLTLLNAIDKPVRDWRWFAKEIEDRVLAVLIALLISPLMLAIAILIKIDSPGPVFFKQKRYGFNNQLIEVLKFRTMHHHAQDPNAVQLTRRNDPRVTRIGRFLRRTSLDELPQFINVVRGEMSIVGPRPHALAAKAGKLLYQEAVRCYDARHRMKPGITGWAQVNGWRGETETVEQIQKRVEHDLYYIEHWSVFLDIKIILRTIVGGFTGRYVY